MSYTTTISYVDAFEMSQALNRLLAIDLGDNHAKIQVRRWLHDLKPMMEERDELIKASTERWQTTDENGPRFNDKGEPVFTDPIAFNREVLAALRTKQDISFRNFGPSLCTKLGRTDDNTTPLIRGANELTIMFGESVPGDVIGALGALIDDDE